MKCAHCKKKTGVTIKCVTCEREYCSGCIQLEIHMCELLHVKIEKEKQILEKNNIRLNPKKV